MKNKITFKYEDGKNMLVLGLGIQAFTKIAELKKIVLGVKAEDSYEELLSKFKTFATNEETVTFEDINGGKANIFEKRDEEDALSEEHVSISSQSVDIGDMINYIEDLVFIKNEEKPNKSLSFNKEEGKDVEPEEKVDKVVPINNAIDKVVKMDGSSFSSSEAIDRQREIAKDEEEEEEEVKEKVKDDEKDG